jgi:tRNA (guanine37-N1)-methyltransferase
MREAAYDIFGNIALVKFNPKTKVSEKKRIANKLLRNNKSIKTILEKTHGFSGRLRKQKTKYVAGEKTKEAVYRENNCVFRFNVDSTYFSPRLSNERKEIAGKVKKGEKVLVMFAGVAPFPIVIAKNSKADCIYSNEINREANKYAELNIGLNNVKEKITLLNGDVKRVAGKVKEKFDVIVMPRPQLKDTFLREAFSLSKKGTNVFYYDFCKDEEIKNVVEKVKEEAKKYRKKIKVLKIKKAGEIAPYRYRIRIDFKVL